PKGVITGLYRRREMGRAPKIGAAIPVVLFFAAIEGLRKSWNVDSTLPDVKKYFVVMLLVIFGIYFSKLLHPKWRDQYTKNLIINLVYLSLISAGLYIALAQIPLRLAD